MINCPLNYADPEEGTREEETSISARKTVTWKSDIATTFKTPQECVGQNGMRKGTLGAGRPTKRVEVMLVGQ